MGYTPKAKIKTLSKGELREKVMHNDQPRQNSQPHQRVGTIEKKEKNKEKKTSCKKSYRTLLMVHLV
jgi:hypothetical protein